MKIYKKLLTLLDKLLFCQKPTKKEVILSKKRSSGKPAKITKHKVYNTDFKKPKRKVKRVFLHCSDTDNPKYDLKAIRKDHIAKGYGGVAYHYFIDKRGTIHKARSLEKKPESHQPYNTGSISICVAGRRIYTKQSMESLKRLCSKINNAYKKITFHGHLEVNKNRTCPLFIYRKVLNLDKNGVMGDLW